MSYYGGGYVSYASYSATSYSTSYDANSCYDTGSYLNNLSHFTNEVSYGSYAGQCANWQNTATTIVLWHLLFPAENASDWQPANLKTIDVELKVDEKEETLDCFTEGVLAFLEQIGAELNTSFREIIIRMPDNVKKVHTDFYHGLLAFLIEIYGLDRVKKSLSVQSTHAEVENSLKTFFEALERNRDLNHTKTAIVKQFVTQTNNLHTSNEQNIVESRESSKRLAGFSLVCGVASAAASFIMLGRVSHGWLVAIIAFSIFSFLCCVGGLLGMRETHKLQRKTLDALKDKASVIEELNALEQA